MLLVVFGAGASHDSVNNEVESRPFTAYPEYQPPLANQLFDRRHIFGGVVSKLAYLPEVIPRLRRFATLPPSHTIEEELNRMDDESSSNPNRRKQLVAVKLYLQETIALCSGTWGREAYNITNYAHLLGVIEDWRCQVDGEVALVTFNYDTLLEQALDGHGMNMSHPNKYITDKRYRLYKLHGSIDWHHHVVLPHGTESMRRRDALVEYADDTRVTSLDLVIQDPFTIETSVVPLSPALAVPLARDKKFVCPDSHLQALRDDLPKVTRMIVVGWAGMDTHFINELKAASCRPQRTLIACNTESAGNETLRRLQPADINRGVRVRNCGFSGLMTERSDDYEVLKEVLG